MQIIEINKTQYRQRLNKVITAFIGLFAVLAIVIGAILIHYFGVDSAAIVQVGADQTVGAPSNFKLNLLGVVLALIFVVMLLNHFKRHDFLQDIYYVWQLKQAHNAIYRKLAKIKAASKSDNPEIKRNALIVLSFYYITLSQVYHLDDNTLTISSVKKELETLEELIASLSEEQSAHQLAQHYQRNMLISF